MTPELIHFIKVNVAIALFYAFYRLFFHRDTFFLWKRTILLCSFVIAVIYPLLDIQEWVKENQPMTAMVTLYTENVMQQLTVTPQEETPPTWQELLPQAMNAAYWGIVLILSLRFLVQLASIIRLRLHSRKAWIEGRQVYLLTKESSPFSFFQWIFLYPQAHTESEISEIIIHEETHARQWHSVDVITGELMCIACWINPFVWLMRREIRNNLEYMADHQVLKTGYDSRTYQYHLLGLAHHKAVAKLSNNFNVLPLKNRIKMMNKKRTRQIGRTKYLMFFPLAALLLVISNIETVARTAERLLMPEKTAPATAAYEEETVFHINVTDHQGKPMPDIPVTVTNNGKESIVKTGENGKADITLDTREKQSITFAVSSLNNKSKASIKMAGIQKEEASVNFMVDKETAAIFSPDNCIRFPGGEKAMIQFLAKNLRYPVEAQKNNEQGRVFMQFRVDSNGKVSNVKVAKSVSPALDAEAIRVVKAMPQWESIVEKGNYSLLSLNIPITFRLDGVETPAELKQPVAKQRGMLEEIVVVGYGMKQ